MHPMNQPYLTRMPQPPKPPQHGILAITGRTLLHTGVLWIITTAVVTTLIAGKPLGDLFIRVAHPYQYAPWCLGITTGLHNDKPTLYFGIVIIAMQAYPDYLLPPLAALALGLAIGSMIRRVIKEQAP